MGNQRQNYGGMGVWAGDQTRQRGRQFNPNLVEIKTRVAATQMAFWDQFPQQIA